MGQPSPLPENVPPAAGPACAGHADEDRWEALNDLASRTAGAEGNEEGNELAARAASASKRRKVPRPPPASPPAKAGLPPLNTFADRVDALADHIGASIAKLSQKSVEQGIARVLGSPGKDDSGPAVLVSKPVSSTTTAVFRAGNILTTVTTTTTTVTEVDVKVEGEEVA
ncbi:hypothetical protein Rhopal_001836-T1 [Rhodotorula paludigena]|uniref:Uncharacterized protein n=1 Tax=Rhodotorula paludigena TaxID=86838 RepID=A0AAV5G8M5_9BASI|nr:hypothetical protein Rhopal_001836-T1 [Rhodotorula paludigena]